MDSQYSRPFIIPIKAAYLRSRTKGVPTPCNIIAMADRDGKLVFVLEGAPVRYASFDEIRHIDRIPNRNQPQ
jgi:hypothetical protein